MVALSVQNISVRINELVLLDQISFDVQEGEVLAIIGPNGAGKTTLLNCITQDVGISSGNILLSEHPLSDWPLKERAQSLAVLPQFSLLNFPYTVEEVVGLGRIPHATGVKRDTAIVDEVMAMLDIGYLKGRLYTQLSGGEKQRTQLARVFAQVWLDDSATSKPNKNRVLLLDEPTSALDLGHQQQFMQIIRDVAKSGVSILMVVHDVNLAFQYADTILALACGRELVQGPPADVMNETLLEKLFGAKLRMLRDPDTDKIVVLS